MRKTYTVNVKRPKGMPDKISHLTSTSFYDYFSVIFLMQKHSKKLCAIPHWLYWKVNRSGYRLEIPHFFLDECLNTKKRFVTIPLCLISNGSNYHANTLVIDTHKMTAERFEPHGARAYKMFWDYEYEILDEELGNFMHEKYGLKYIAPVAYCPALGPQSFEEHIDEEGYCATWSLWYTDMRISNPNVSREKLVEGMFTKLEEKLAKGTLTDYLLDYAMQVYYIMLKKFPQYTEYFLDYDMYKDLSEKSKKGKKFGKFMDDIENVIAEPTKNHASVVIKRARILKKKPVIKFGKKKSKRKLK